jgi:hypothetical protein
MVNVKLFAAEGEKVIGLSQITEGTIGAVPKEGDIIGLGAQISDKFFKVKQVSFLLNENAVFLIVSPIN